MPDMQREVAGIRCAGVLERLSDYMDGALPPREAQQVEAHVMGCDWCERFGGEFAGAVAALRRQLREAAPLDEEVAGRLRDRLRELTGR